MSAWTISAFLPSLITGLLTGAITLAGVIYTQRHAADREDRRWDREGSRQQEEELKPRGASTDTQHEILRLTREVDASIDTVWAAYANVENRRQWSVPAGEHIVYDAADFTAEGEDTYRCGPPGDLSNLGAHRYVVIDAPRRLIFSDTIRRDGEVMAVAVLTWEFEATGDGARITVVDQVTSLAGQGMIDGHRNGHDKTLDQLADWLR